MTYTRLNPVDKVTTQSGWTVTTRTDGLVEVKKDITVTINAADWKPWQVLYYADVLAATAYPFAFRSRPNVRAELFRAENHEVMGFSFGHTNNAMTYSPALYVLALAAYTTATIVGVTLYATGTPA